MSVYKPKREQLISCSLFVPEAGLEPAQPQWPKDFHTNLEFAWTMS